MATAPALDRTRWLIVALVFVAIMLNYVDRQIIALLKPTLQAEFGWSERDYGHMASAFQFAAAIGYLVAGWLLDRVGLRRGFALGAAIWSLAGMAHAFVAGVTGFLGARIVLGLAEATGTPAVVKTAATYFGPAERTRMLGISNMAPNIGAIVTPLVIPALAIALGWRATFLIAGGLGLLWVACWLAVRPPAIERQAAEAAEAAEAEAEAEAEAPVARIGYGRLLRTRQAWALIGAKALTDQVWWLLLFFLPDLFHRVFGLGQAALGPRVALAYTLAAAGSFVGGWLPGRMMARGVTQTAARKRTMLLFALLIVPVPTVLLAGDAWIAALILGIALFAHQGFSTNIFGAATDLFPARAVGSAIGLAAFFGNIAGMAMLEYAGWSLDRGHGYAPMLAIASVSYLLALGVLQLVVPRLDRAELG